MNDYDPNLKDSLLKENSKKPHIEDAFQKNAVTPILGGQIALNPTISIINFCAYLLLQFTYSFVVLSIDSFQIPLLEIRYGVSKDDVDTTNSIILVFDLVFKVCMSPIYGYLCDKFGRRIFVMYGLASFTAAAFLYPLFSQVYPYIIFARLLFANGVLAVNIAPLLADYVDYNTKGRMAGVLTLIGSFSGYIASFFQQSSDLTDTIHMKYIELGIGCGVIGVIICFGLKGGAYHKTLFNDPNAKRVRKMLNNKNVVPEKVNVSTGEMAEAKAPINYNNDRYSQDQQNEDDDVIKQIEEEEEEEKKESKIQKILAGFKQAKNPWILIGFMVTYLGVAQGGILTFVLVSWVNSKTGGDPNQATQSYALSNKALLTLVVSALFFGFFSDKYSKFKVLLFTLFSALAGIVFLIFAPTPYNWMAYAAMVFTGFGNSGFSVALNTLVNKYAEPRYRAVVSSAAQILHVLGFANSSLLGVYLVQFNLNIPLYIYGTACIITLITLVTLYSTSKVMRKI